MSAPHQPAPRGRRLVTFVACLVLVSGAAPSATATHPVIGTEAPVCVILEAQLEMSCADAAELFGLDPDEVLTSVGAYGITADYDFDPWDDAPVLETIDAGLLECLKNPDSEECYLITHQAHAAADDGGGGGFSTWGVEWESDRPCFANPPHSKVEGVNNRWEARPRPNNTDFKWRIWTQHHTGRRKHADDELKYVITTIKARNGRMVEFDPDHIRDVGEPTIWNLGVGVTVGGASFGGSVAWNVYSEKAGGEPRQNLTKHFAGWGGSTDGSRAIKAEQIWKIPKGQTGEFVIDCSAGSW